MRNSSTQKSIQEISLSGRETEEEEGIVDPFQTITVKSKFLEFSLCSYKSISSIEYNISYN